MSRQNWSYDRRYRTDPDLVERLIRKGVPQMLVARRTGLSQSRVSQIAKRLRMMAP